MYEYGLGVPLDYAEAQKWYSLAAQQGYAGAKSNLSRLYREGRISR
jgi:TPR repeat protein